MKHPSRPQPSPDEASDRLTLFGSPRIRYASAQEDAALEWGRPTALVAYLACRPGWHSRDALARLLRPDAVAASARAYLRRLIHRTRDLHPRLRSLEVEDDRVRWAGDSDVADFLQAMEESDWERAVAAQPAPLLAAAGSAGPGELEDCLREERARMRHLLRGALTALLVRERQEGRDRSALMQRLAADDPADENGVQFLLAEARTPLEQHAAANAFQALQRRFAAEAGRKPLPRTIELHEQLRAGAQPVAVPNEPVPPERHPPPVAGPPALLGREAELLQLEALLAREDVRLVSILGFGGVGKTALARALFERLRQRPAPACAWVDLQAADTADAMLDSMASQLGVVAHESSLQAQLEAWLAARELLVFLDNFEQLAAHAPLLERLLRGAPGARFVATSRETLRLPGEYPLHLAGLPCQGPGSPAATLFAQHAARNGGAVSASEGPAIALVEYLEGLPLAIELASSWSAVLNPAAILDELRQNPEFLDASGAGARAGSRTMNTVLKAIWRRLSPAEQDALGGLALVLGPVDFDTARSVAEAGPAVLLGLVQKSILRRDGNVFRLHPLLRQFAASRAAADVIAAAQERHAEHFLGRLARLPRLRPGAQLPGAATMLLAWTEDLGKAWRFAVDAGRTDLLAGALPQLAILLLAGSRQEDGEQWAAYAAARLAGTALAADLAALQALSAWRCGRMDEAEATALAAIGQGAAGSARAWLALCISRVCWFRSDYVRALATAEEALASTPQDDPWLHATVLLDLAHARYGLGQLAPARGELVASLELARRHEARHTEAYALGLLGVVCTASEQAGEALAYLQASLRIFRELEVPFSIAFTLRCISYAHFRLRDPARQAEAARMAYDTFRAAGYEHELGESLLAIGLAHHAAGRAQEAVQACRESLARCLQASNLSGALRCIILLGIFALDDDRAWGVAVACFAAAHPSVRQPDIHVMEEMLRARGISSEELAQGRRTAASLDLDEVCGRLLGRSVRRRS